VKREHDLEQCLRSLESLEYAVTAMKSLSGHHFRQTRATLEPARRYHEGIRRVVAELGASLPAGKGPGGLLVIGSELGLCGGYNAHVVAEAARHLAAARAGLTLCVGRRAATYLVRRAIEVDRTYPAPTSVAGIPDLLLRLAQDMLGAYVSRRMSRFEVVSSRFEGIGGDHPVITRLLPVGVERSEVAFSARYASRERFDAVAVRELLYISMYSLLLDALASEHGARLVATQSAEQWLEERTRRLRRQLMASRREAGTQETLEVATGARARARERARKHVAVRQGLGGAPDG